VGTPRKENQEYEGYRFTIGTEGKTGVLSCSEFRLHWLSETGPSAAQFGAIGANNLSAPLRTLYKSRSSGIQSDKSVVRFSTFTVMDRVSEAVIIQIDRAYVCIPGGIEWIHSKVELNLFKKQ
jgi:hypothetical protein